MRFSRRTVRSSSWGVWYSEDTAVEDGEAERSLFASCLRARASYHRVDISIYEHPQDCSLIDMSAKSTLSAKKEGAIWIPRCVSS